VSLWEASAKNQDIFSSVISAAWRQSENKRAAFLYNAALFQKSRAAGPVRGLRLSVSYFILLTKPSSSPLSYDDYGNYAQYQNSGSDHDKRSFF
jgi:hypothetical protein